MTTPETGTPEDRSLAIGRTAEFTHVVGPDDTAISVGSGDVPVLATPRVLALAEAATVAAISTALEPGQTSVGTRVELDHLVASPVGDELRVVATLTQVAGRHLLFEVRAERVADGRTVSRGQVSRTVVDKDRFMLGH